MAISKAGSRTKKIVQSLRDNLARQARYKDIEVFYDHGGKSDPAVCEPTPLMGREYGRDAKLAAVDIAVLRKGNVSVVVEVEESKAEPKRVLGDIFSVVLSSGMQIQGKRYGVKGVTVVIAILLSGDGQKQRQFSRLEKLLKGSLDQHKPSTVRKVRIIACRDDEIIERVERLVRLEIGKG